MSARLEAPTGYLATNLSALEDVAVESESVIAERVRSLRREAPLAQITAAGLVGGLDRAVGRRIAAAVSEPARQYLQLRRSLVAAQGFLRMRAGDPAGGRARGLLLVGPPGVGKTLAATYVVASSHVPIPPCPCPSGLVEKYVRSAWATSSLNASIGALHKFNKDPAAFKKMRTAKILFIDDLGEEHEDIGPTLRECLDGRKENRGCLTVVTTTLSTNALLDRYGPAVADRMRELFVRAEITGPSLRESERGW